MRQHKRSLPLANPVLRHFCVGHTPACMPPAHGQSDNMQAFQQPKNQMPFTGKILRQVRWDYRWRSICQRTGGMIRITHWWRMMSVWLVWQLIRLPIWPFCLTRSRLTE